MLFYSGCFTSIEIVIWISSSIIVLTQNEQDLCVESMDYHYNNLELHNLIISLLSDVERTPQNSKFSFHITGLFTVTNTVTDLIFWSL